MSVYVIVKDVPMQDNRLQDIVVDVTRSRDDAASVVAEYVAHGWNAVISTARPNCMCVRPKRTVRWRRWASGVRT